MTSSYLGASGAWELRHFSRVSSTISCDSWYSRSNSGSCVARMSEILVRILVRPEMTRENFQREMWMRDSLFCWTLILVWWVWGPMRHGSCSSKRVIRAETHSTGLGRSAVILARSGLGGVLVPGPAAPGELRRNSSRVWGSDQPGALLYLLVVGQAHPKRGRGNGRREDGQPKEHPSLPLPPGEPEPLAREKGASPGGLPPPLSRTAD